MRFLASLPGYVYAGGKDGVYVNLYVAGSGEDPLLRQHRHADARDSAIRGMALCG